MATRFLRYDSDPILRKKCKAVLKVDDKIRQLLDDMLDTLHETENGAALAANQVGVLKRLVVIDFNDTRLKLVNPQMISQSGVQECVEGCLSFPNRFVKTIRPQKVTIQALNEYGEEMIIDGEDEMAKCFCHELEHLDGMIFLDKAIEELSALWCKLTDAVSEKEKEFYEQSYYDVRRMWFWKDYLRQEERTGRIYQTFHRRRNVETLWEKRN